MKPYSLPILGLALALVLPLAACDDPPNQQGQPQQVPAAQAPGTATAPGSTAWYGNVTDAVDTTGLLATNYYLVFDGSGSMKESSCSNGERGGRIAVARRAMLGFIDRIPADANVGLFVFDGTGSGERVQLGRGEANRRALAQAIEAVKADSGTPLGAALFQAMRSLSAQAARQGGYGEYNIVVATDGAASDDRVMEQAVTQITRTPVVLQTVGFCIGSGHALHRPGNTIYRNANNPAELERGLQAVLAESRTFEGATTFGGPQR